MDREAWCAVVHWVTKSRTRLVNWTEAQCFINYLYIWLQIQLEFLIGEKKSLSTYFHWVWEFEGWRKPKKNLVFFILSFYTKETYFIEAEKHCNYQRFPKCVVCSWGNGRHIAFAHQILFDFLSTQEDYIFWLLFSEIAAMWFVCRLNPFPKPGCENSNMINHFPFARWFSKPIF